MGAFRGISRFNKTMRQSNTKHTYTIFRGLLFRLRNFAQSKFNVSLTSRLRLVKVPVPASTYGDFMVLGLTNGYH